MAYFHLEAKVISRGSGRSAIAAAAYASCSKLYNDYDGLCHDYTRKRGCLYSEIFLPDAAPPEWKDRQLLWEAVESAEKTKNSRLARELIVALPVELSFADWKAMLERFVREQGTGLGMCADVNIHDTDGHNPHSHILFTVRPLDEHGRWQAKTQKEYLCRRGEEERGFTADEFKVAKTQGWEKQYLYQYEEKKEYLTPSKAEKLVGCVRTSKIPKSTRYGRENPISDRWNSEEQLLAWRKSWEVIVNKQLERHGILERVDCRSHAARGLTEQPTVHEGYYARKLETIGFISDRCEMNRQIKEDNTLLRQLKKQVQKLVKAVTESVPSIAAALEGLRDHMVLLQYQLIVNTSQQNSLNSQRNILSGILEDYQETASEIKAKNAERKSLIAEQKASGIHFIRANKLGKKIAALTEDLEELKSRKEQLLARMGCQSGEVHSRQKKIKDMDICLGKLEVQRIALSEQKQKHKNQFLEIRGKVAPENQEAVQEKRAAIRFAGKSNLIQKLFSVYRERYSTNTFEKANRQINAELQEQPVHEKKRSIKERLHTARQEVSQARKKSRGIER